MCSLSTDNSHVLQIMENIGLEETFYGILIEG